MSLHCTFSVDQYSFALPVEDVQEVLRGLGLTRVPLSRPEVRGLINLRGQIVTAIDLRRRLGLPERNADGCRMNVLVATAGGTVSLLVDRIDDIVDVDDAAVERPPETVQGDVRSLIRGACKLKGRLLLLLDTVRTVTLPS